MADNPGEVFADYVKEQIELEDKRRASLETRGVGVITVSGTLVTLLFGVATVVTKGSNYVPPPGVADRLTWALVAFAASSLVAIGTTIPLATNLVDGSTLGGEILSRWDGTVDAARKKVTATRVADLASAQRANNIKSLLLIGAVFAQVVAVILLAWAVVGLLA